MPTHNYTSGETRLLNQDVFYFSFHILRFVDWAVKLSGFLRPPERAPLLSYGRKWQVNKLKAFLRCLFFRWFHATLLRITISQGQNNSLVALFV